MNKSDILGVVGFSKMKNTSVTYPTANEKWFETERSKIIQEDLDALLMLNEHLERNLEIIDNEDNLFKTR